MTADGRERGRIMPSLWVLLTVAAMTLALSLAAAGPGALPFDPEAARVVQRAPDPPGAALARFGDLMGGLAAVVGIGVLVALLLLAAGFVADAALLLAAVACRALNPALKAILGSPRPTADAVRVTEQVADLGFPSGHAMGAVLLWGALAWLAQRVVRRPAPRLLIQAAAVAVILAAGFARVYTGAHWPSDVVGGVLWGAFLLLLLARAEAALGIAGRLNGLAPAVRANRWAPGRRGQG